MARVPYVDVAKDAINIRRALANSPAAAQKNTALAIEYCLAHPRWRLSLQTHKYTGIR